MYPFYEVSIFKVKKQAENVWAVVTLEGGNSTIVWWMDLEEDALDEQKLRLAEGAERMTRYGGGQIVRDLKTVALPSASEVKNYAADNSFTWELDLHHVTFEKWSRIRLTRAEVSDETLDSQMW